MTTEELQRYMQPFEIEQLPKGKKVPLVRRSIAHLGFGWERRFGTWKEDD